MCLKKSTDAIKKSINTNKNDTFDSKNSTKGGFILGGVYFFKNVLNFYSINGFKNSIDAVFNFFFNYF